MTDIGTEVQLQQELDEVRRAHNNTLRKLDQANRKKEALVAAVYQAARDAAAGFSLPPIKPPALDKRRKDSEVAICPLADWQLAKVTPTYTTEMCEERIARYGDKVELLTNIQRAHHPVKECRVYLLGDLVEGELIFPGQEHLIDASLYRQVMVDGPRILGDFLRRMLGMFDKVRVVGVIGNHGKLGGRASKNYHPESNADAMMYEATRLFLGDQPRLEWQPAFQSGERAWWAMDQVGEKKFFLFHGDQVKGGFAGFPWYGFCVPTDHEILTARGWKTFDQVSVGEPVLTYDHLTHENRWEPLEAVNTFEYDGELKTLERPGGHEIAFTPEHRWPTETQDGKRDLISASEFNTGHRLPIQGEFYGTQSILSPRLAALLGWLVTDGTARWIGNHWEAGIYQSPRKHLAEVVALVGREARPARTDGKDDVQYVALTVEDRRSLNEFYRTKDDLPGIVGRLSREAAEAMHDAMMKAEGTTTAAGQRIFCQNLGPVADAFQMLCVLLGQTAWAVSHSTDGRCVNMTLRREQLINPTWKEGLGSRQFKGTVWCPSTPTGTWWVRHKGMVMPTGNSKKVMGWALSSIGEFDYAIAGHFHTPTRMLIANKTLWVSGSTESTNTYALEMLAAQGDPSQWLLFCHPRRGVTAEYKVELLHD